MARHMLVNVTEGQECRIAVTEGGHLEEIYFERAGNGNLVGNVYKARVVSVESSIQAAFLEFGGSRNGFLHISDLHSRYFPGDGRHTESVGRRKPLKDRPLMQECLKKDQQLIVQVTKEGVNSKGPTLTSYVALAGKYLVMMPWMHGNGVSHRIEDAEERDKLLNMFAQCNPPKEHGFIIRTAGSGCTRRDVTSDLRYLSRLWAAIEKRMKTEDVPAELYRESDLVTRVLRDVFDSRIEQIVCDSESVVRKIKDFLKLAAPRLKCQVIYHSDKVPLFHTYHLEQKLADIQSRTVKLKDGGSVIIEQTEALVSIDVNSGRSRQQSNAEQTAYKTNMQAAEEIARQLRLRDLGGLIICDFIDMRNARHRKNVEKAFQTAVKADRAHHEILDISRFGVVEMTRQRMRSNLQSTNYLACQTCGGTGLVKSCESLSIEIIRLLNASVFSERVSRVEVLVSPDVADYLQNRKRAVLARLEQVAGKCIVVRAVVQDNGERYKVVCYDDRDCLVKP